MNAKFYNLFSLLFILTRRLLLFFFIFPLISIGRSFSAVDYIIFMFYFNERNQILTRAFCERENVFCEYSRS